MKSCGEADAVRNSCVDRATSEAGNNQAATNDRGSEAGKSSITNRRPSVHAKVSADVELWTDLKNASFEVHNSGADEWRVVPPYYQDFKAFAKKRWLGRTLEDVFRSEFPFLSQNYVDKAIQCGRITINGNQTQPSAKFGDRDFVCHRLHRHEPPIRNRKIQVLTSPNPDILVVCKPAGMPVGPCGRFQRNTMVSILVREMNEPNVRICHRLDRLTSGIMLIARTQEMASQLGKAIQSRDCQKYYLAKVIGKGPGPQEHTASCSKVVKVDAPLSIANRSVGCWTVSPGGKESVTFFRTIATRPLGASYSSSLLHQDDSVKSKACGSHSGQSSDLKEQWESLVLCKPVTGRTHQIRVHLRHLGMPILNDPLYGPDKEDWFGDARDSQRRKRARPDLSFEQDTGLNLQRRNWLDSDGICEVCSEWKKSGIDGYSIDKRTLEDDVECDCIYLHSLQYEIQGNSFRAPMPEWASSFGAHLPDQLSNLFDENS